MSKTMGIVVSLLALAMLVTACASSAAPSPSPTVSEPTAPPETPGAAPEDQADVFMLVGEEAVITVGGTKISGGAYYVGENEDEMIFPLAEVAKALGWTVDEPAAPGAAEMKLTRSGAEEVVIAYTRPDRDTKAGVEGVTVTKAGGAVDVGNEPAHFIDGTLYVSGAFISAAVQEITVDYDGARSITIETKV